MDPLLEQVAKHVRSRLHHNLEGPANAQVELHVALQARGTALVVRHEPKLASNLRGRKLLVDHLKAEQDEQSDETDSIPIAKAHVLSVKQPYASHMHAGLVTGGTKVGEYVYTTEICRVHLAVQSDNSMTTCCIQSNCELIQQSLYLSDKILSTDEEGHSDPVLPIKCISNQNYLLQTCWSL